MRVLAQLAVTAVAAAVLLAVIGALMFIAARAGP